MTEPFLRSYLPPPLLASTFRWKRERNKAMPHLTEKLCKYKNLEREIKLNKKHL